MTEKEVASVAQRNGWVAEMSHSEASHSAKKKDA